LPRGSSTCWVAAESEAQRAKSEADADTLFGIFDSCALKNHHLAFIFENSFQVKSQGRGRYE